MKPFYLACYTLALALLPARLPAATNANDAASNYAGHSTYVGVSGGTGWSGAFTAESSSPQAFLGSSPQIDTNGLSFGLSGGSVARFFGSGNGTQSYYLSANQTFQCQLQPGSVVQGGQIGVSIANGFNLSTGVGLSYTGGNQDYTLNIETYGGSLYPTTQTIDTGVPFSANALTVSFSQVGSTFTLSLTPAGGATTSFTNAYTGAAEGVMFNTTNGSTMYFNSLAVVPEPASWVVLILGLCGWMGRHLIRNRRVDRSLALLP